MIDGITILNTSTEIFYTWGWNSWCKIWSIILTITITFLILVFYFRDSLDDDLKLYLIPPLIILIVVSIPAILICASEGKVDYEINTYDVTIDDNVKFNEVMNNYEIIEHKGQIYTIKELRPET